MTIINDNCDWCSKELDKTEKNNNILFNIDLCWECRREAINVLLPVYRKCSSKTSRTHRKCDDKYFDKLNEDSQTN